MKNRAKSVLHFCQIRVQILLPDSYGRSVEEVKCLSHTNISCIKSLKTLYREPLNLSCMLYLKKRPRNDIWQFFLCVFLNHSILVYKSIKFWWSTKNFYPFFYEFFWKTRLACVNLVFEIIFKKIIFCCARLRVDL